MNRESGCHLPIPVTPRESPSEQPLLQSSPKQKRRSRERRASFSLFPGKQQKTSPIWRPSTGHTPPAPQWPLPRVPIKIHDENPALTTTYTLPRGAPLPPAPAAYYSNRSSSGSSTTTLTEDQERHPPSQGNASPSPSSPRTPRHPRSPRTPAAPPRPALLHQRGAASFQTRYLNMLLNLDKIPRAHNILANLFAWMVLVAFVIAPGNFTGPDESLKLSEKDRVSSTPLATTTTLKKIPSIPLLAICSASFFFGVLGMLWLAVYWRRNYIWLMNRVYLPLLLNSLAGFIATLVVVDVQHAWHWSISALVTVAVEGGTLAISLGLFVLYDYWLLAKLKREHYRETSRKRVVDLVKAGKAPPFAPGSVV
ncbi:hypothetical protein VMCG_10662 [Cytospora schulzeri]|uniref:Uncharacterized protein n=1 Tax=Cytospora schulzeri TaxID=448051 RepID=A0A423V8L6_9PEZI|nr:hypothetical protein VMCG_10662 [Valsa malicola]